MVGAAGHLYFLYRSRWATLTIFVFPWEMVTVEGPPPTGSIWASGNTSCTSAREGTAKVNGAWLC